MTWRREKSIQAMVVIPRDVTTRRQLKTQLEVLPISVPAGQIQRGRFVHAGIHDTANVQIACPAIGLKTNLTAISVPLRNDCGEIVAAVNVCGQPSSLSAEFLEQKCLPPPRDTCHRISRLLV